MWQLQCGFWDEGDGFPALKTTGFVGVGCISTRGRAPYTSLLDVAGCCSMLDDIPWDVTTITGNFDECGQHFYPPEPSPLSMNDGYTWLSEIVAHND